MTNQLDELYTKYREDLRRDPVPDMENIEGEIATLKTDLYEIMQDSTTDQQLDLIFLSWKHAYLTRNGTDLARINAGIKTLKTHLDNPNKWAMIQSRYRDFIHNAKEGDIVMSTAFSQLLDRI